MSVGIGGGWSQFPTTPSQQKFFTRDFRVKSNAVCSPIVIEQRFGSHASQSTWTTSGTVTLEDSTDHYGSGVDCAVITTNGTGGGAYMQSPAFSAPWDLSNSTLILAVKVVDPSVMKSTGFMQVYIGSDTNANSWINYHEFTLGRANDLSYAPYLTSAGGWNFIAVPWSMMNSTGGTGCDKANVRCIRIRVWDNGSVPTVVKVGMVGIVRNVAAQYPKGALCISIDDGSDTVYRYAWPVLRALGVGATLHVIDSVLDTAAFLTTAQCNEMQAGGCDISPHCYDYAIHAMANGYTTAETNTPGSALADMQSSVAFHAARGWDTRHLAYPGGNYNETVVQAARTAGFATARTTYGMDSMMMETAPPYQPHKTIGWSFNGSTLAQLTGTIDTFLTRAPAICIRNFHTFGTATSGQTVNWRDFAAFLEYAAITKGIPILTESQLFP